MKARTVRAQRRARVIWRDFKKKSFLKFFSQKIINFFSKLMT